MNISAFRQEVGWRIQQIRLLRNMNQSELAEAIGVTRTSIANLEAGRQNATIDKVVEIARVLGCSALDIIPSERQIQNINETDWAYVKQLENKIDELERKLDLIQIVLEGKL